MENEREEARRLAELLDGTRPETEASTEERELLASGRAQSIAPSVLDAFFTVADDDEELRALNLARRERRSVRS